MLGIDYSSAFVAAGQQLKEVGEMPYFLKTEGDLGETKIAKVDPDIVSQQSVLGMMPIPRSRSTSHLTRF